MTKLFYFLIFFCAIKTIRAQSWNEVATAGSYLNANGYINALCNDPTGNIYAGGLAYNDYGWSVGKWDGASWTDVREGTNPIPNTSDPNSFIQTMCSDPSGNIYVAGLAYVSKWNGTTWTDLGNYAPNNPMNNNKRILSVCSDPSGNIYVAGYFENSNAKTYVSKWDGNTWSEVGPSNPYANDFYISTLATSSTGDLYVPFWVLGKYQIIKWDGNAWTQLGSLDANGIVYAIDIDANGNVYAAGGFTNGSGNQYVAKWNGNSWAELSSPIFNQAIYAMDVQDENNVYVGGLFSNSSNKYYVAKWNGTSWSELGQLNANDVIYSILVNQGHVYATGRFTNAGGYQYVAEYDSGTTTEITDEQDEIGGIYPNPSLGNLYFTIEQPSLLTIYNDKGTLVYSRNVTQADSPIQLNVLSNGMYTAYFQEENGKKRSYHFIKQ